MTPHARIIAPNPPCRFLIGLEAYLAYGHAQDNGIPSLPITQDRSNAYLACAKCFCGLMSHQPQLPGFDDWLPEVKAAEHIRLDSKTLRDMRSGRRKGITPFRECGGKYYYLRADLDVWLANNAQRDAGKTSGIFFT